MLFINMENLSRRFWHNHVMIIFCRGSNVNNYNKPNEKNEMK